MHDITQYLKLMVEKNASDLFFSTGSPVNVKVEGVSKPIGDRPLPPGMVKEIAYSIMSGEQVKTFEATLEMNLALAVQSLGRFRVNVYRQRGEVSMVVRYIKSHVPSIAQLQLPPILNDLVMEPRGLVLIVGSTGSGKSTTLASMISHRNQQTTGHILTVEDPIEYLHKNVKSIVDQREVGLDTLSYGNALKNAMREAPDVVLIGEIRDRETMQHAIEYAETGHLCLSTLHANNANQTLDRILNFFPEDAHRQLLMDLSLNLRAVVSQRLVIGVDQKRVPVAEVMLNSSYISELILKGQLDKLKEAMEHGVESGMQTFDQSLYTLYQAGRISADEALHNADSRNNLALKIRLGKGSNVHVPDGLSIDTDKTQRP